MRTKMMLVIATLIAVISTQVLANEEQEKIYLIQMINQLDALKPLLLAAANEEPKNTRTQFHYIAYRDADGKLHNGLLEDINEIKLGIKARLGQATIEPHNFQAIKGDYINHDIVKSRQIMESVHVD